MNRFAPFGLFFARSAALRPSKPKPGLLGAAAREPAAQGRNLFSDFDGTSELVPDKGWVPGTNKTDMSNQRTINHPLGHGDILPPVAETIDRIAVEMESRRPENWAPILRKQWDRRSALVIVPFHLHENIHGR